MLSHIHSTVHAGRKILRREEHKGKVDKEEGEKGYVAFFPSFLLGEEKNTKCVPCLFCGWLDGCRKSRP